MTGKSERPLISIILLCYNQERFVGEAVDGVLSQTYAPLEIVILDDCSTDRTAAIVEARLAAHPDRSDVRFVRNPRNLTARINAKQGLDMTTGDFILYAYGDDIMLPRMVETMAKVWIEEDVSLVTVNAFYIDAESRPLNRTFRDPNVKADESFETLARDGANAVCFGPGIGFERDLYTTFGIPPVHLGAGDIIIPFWAYLRKGARFIETPLTKYRAHDDNSSVSIAAERAAGRANERGRLIASERAHFQHLAHALLMQEQLSDFSARWPDRYSELQKKISPLLTIQTVEMAKKLVADKIKLDTYTSIVPGMED